MGLYDAFGRRVAKSSDSSLYFYDQTGHLLARRMDDAAGDRVRSYIYAEDELMGFVDLVEGPPGGCAGLPPLGRELGLPDFWWLTVPATALLVLLVPALRRRPIAATSVVTIALVVGAAGVARSRIVSVAFFWVHTDHLGTPLAVTDTPANPATAKVVWRATYEAFGRATVDEDPDGDQVPVSLNVRFPGQYYDAESGLHYNYFRTYDPNTGRYLEADPIGQLGGINVYAYVENDPLSYADPFGVIAFICQKPLNALGGGTGKKSWFNTSWNPLYHQYLCVAGPGGVTCGGQTSAGAGAGGSLLEQLYNEGAPSNDYFDPNKCDPTGPHDDCLDKCLLKAFTGKRPGYGFVLKGTNCQEWSNDVLSLCERICRNRRKP